MKRSFESLSAGVQKKRQKLRSARTIASESASNSIKSGNVPLQEFLSSRRFEIKALVDSVQKSREAGVQRAFQSLPRYLRRRAASHNVKRVPRRIRARAIGELTEDDRKTQYKRKIPFKRKRGRRGTILKLKQIQQTLTRTAEKVPEETARLGETELPLVKPMRQGRFVNRQRNKTWLPSHLWTCKRAKMETRWNYAIPITPNEKTYRSTHRASTSKGAIIFDTSYRGSLLLSGPADKIGRILEKLTGSRLSSGLRARNGQRCIDASIYNQAEFLCPVNITWDSSSTESAASVLLVLHPAEFLAVWQLVISYRTLLKLDEVKLIDMRFQIGSIEIVGPLATNALLSILKCTVDSSEVRAFRSLHGLSPDEWPTDIVIPLQAKNPKSSFPPKMISEPAKTTNTNLTKWPRHTCGSPLFSLESVQRCNETRPRSLPAEGAVPEIPVLVQHTRLGLTLLGPWAYITDFWYSLNHLPLVRFGGQQEYAQIHYERVTPYFPVDFPGTPAGNSLAKENRDIEEKTYLRRPPAKRTSYAKAIDGKPELGDPFGCDFTFLFTSAGQSSGDLSHISASIIDRDTTVDITMEDVTVPLYTSTPQIPPSTHSPPKSMPKQTISQDVPAAVQEAVLPVVPLLLMPEQLLALTKDQMERGIVQVRVRMIQRGCPTSRARIYGMNDSAPGPLIGFVTTGNFSLSEGRATGLGCIRLMTIHGSRKGMCFIRDVGTGNFRKAEWSML